MFVEFEKWHGCKNDFIVFWVNENQYDNIAPSLRRQCQHLCSRNEGIGADGILFLTYSSTQPIPQKLLILNSDGSEAKTCGNGIRCGALSIFRRQLEVSKNELESLNLQMGDQTYSCQFLPQKGQLPLVQVNMGTPWINEQNLWHENAKAFLTQKLQKTPQAHLLNEVYTCALANHHIVFICEREEALETLRQVGSMLQTSPHWDGINVSFATPFEDKKGQTASSAIPKRELADPYKAFVWERGAGETQACGSGACAIAASLLSSGLHPRSQWIPILFPGGPLFVRQKSAEDEAILCGPGNFVFSGKIEI